MALRDFIDTKEDCSACVASAIALAYRVLQTKNVTNANWLLGPLGVAVYVTVASTKSTLWLADIFFSDAELTAGIMVCCMPSTAQVFMQVKKSAPSIKSSYNWAFRSISKPDPTTSYELSSDSTLHHQSGKPSYESHETSRPERAFTLPELKSDHRLDSSVACEDGIILKTTDIQVKLSDEKV